MPRQILMHLHGPNWEALAAVVGLGFTFSSRRHLVDTAVQAYLKYPEFIGPILAKAAGPLAQRPPKPPKPPREKRPVPKDRGTPLLSKPVQLEPRTFWCMLKHSWVMETESLTTRCPECGRVSVGSATEMPEVTQGDVLALLRLNPKYNRFGGKKRVPKESK